MRKTAGVFEIALALLPLAGMALLFGLMMQASRFETALISVRPATPWLALPAAETLIERIAFGSCLHQERPQPIWNAVIATKPQLFVMMGDNVYGDFKDAGARELRAAYAAQLRHAEFSKARAVLPFHATWDDHDFGSNDNGADFAFKAQARALFNDYWSVRGERAERPGVYDSLAFGPSGKRVQIILLDLRTFRSAWKEKPKGTASPGPYVPDIDAGKSMLGAQQWAWLEAVLRRPADLRVIVSSIQVIADGHGFERWGNFPLERERFFQLIGSTGAKGVVLLSGDRHYGSLYKKSDGVPYPLVEMTSSALNLPLPPKYRIEAGTPERIGEGYRLENFGTLKIDWAARKLALSLHGVTGAEVASISVPFSDLGY